MAASLHFIDSVELITIALLLLLSCSISLVAARATLEAVFLLMLETDGASTVGMDRDV
jgi:hypothetical protein